MATFPTNVLYNYFVKIDFRDPKGICASIQIADLVKHWHTPRAFVFLSKSQIW